MVMEGDFRVGRGWDLLDHQDSKDVIVMVGDLSEPIFEISGSVVHTLYINSACENCIQHWDN